jgi:hypothetical protein
MARRLRRRFPETQVHTFGYPSRRSTISESSARLSAYLNQITTTEPVSFIGHSLGGIIVRSLDLSARPKAPLHRLVTLGSPHNGAKIARFLSRYTPARSIFGPILSELGTLNLADTTRDLEIGCIVGATGMKVGFLPFLGGDNDGLVLSAEASFPGCVDRIELVSFHGLMPFSKRLSDLAGDFLERGRFR